MPDDLTARRPGPTPGLISLVIPVYNEDESLRPLVSEIMAVAGGLGRRVEIIFVDDGSTDGSWTVIGKLAGEHPKIQGVRFRRNFGKAAALQAGFARAAGEIVFTLDADLQDDPHEIPKFLAAIDGGLDLVSGWKQVRHDPWHKVFPSRVFNWMVSSLTGVKLHDHNCGFKAYRHAVVREVRLYGELHRFVPALADANGFRVGELVVHHRARKFGHSKFGAKRFLKGFLDLLSVWFVTTYGRRPMHALGAIGLILGLLGSGGLLVLLANGLVRWVFDTSFGLALGGQLLVGFSSAIAVVLGGQAFVAGFVAELLAARMAGFQEPYRVSDRTPSR